MVHHAHQTAPLSVCQTTSRYIALVRPFSRPCLCELSVSLRHCTAGMHLVPALVFLVDPLEHFISLASARDELIFDFGFPGRLFCGLWLRAAHSPADFFKVAMEHDFHCFQCVQVGRRDGGLDTQGSQGCSRGCDGCGIWRMEKARFVQACWHARVEVEEEACNARTG